MATYTELHDLLNDGALLDKIDVAVIIAAHGFVGGSALNQPQLDKWAEQTFSNPRAMSKRLLPFVLAANKDATASNIKSAADTAIQTNVNAAIDLFADLIA